MGGTCGPMASIGPYNTAAALAIGADACIRPLLCYNTLGNTAQFPPSGLSTAPADLRAKSRRKASVALRSASLRLGVRHGICVAKMLDNVGLRYPHRASGTKAPRTLRPLPLLRFAVSATGGAHLCSTKYYLRFWLSICRTSLAVSALRIMRYCLKSSTNP